MIEERDKGEIPDDFFDYLDDEPTKCPHGVMEWEDGCFQCEIEVKDRQIKDLTEQLAWSKAQLDMLTEEIGIVKSELRKAIESNKLDN